MYKIEFLSTPVKYLLTILATTIVVSGVIYAADIITLTQTANTGDKITAQWVNAVNTKTSAIPAAAAGGNVSCSTVSTIVFCVWADGTCRMSNTLWSGGGWSSCTNALP